MTTHEIISAKETPSGNVVMEINWSGDSRIITTATYGPEAAKALGWKRPDPQPVDPAWMVEVARDVFANEAENEGQAAYAREIRAGGYDGDVVPQRIVFALRLALSRGHVVLAPVMPSEEEMLRDAREDAAQVQEANGDPTVARETRSGARDHGYAMKVALQARRNVYASLGAVAGKAVSSGPVVPEVDLRGVAKKAWANGFTAAINALQNFGESGGYEVEREKDVSAILETLKIGEA